MKIFLLIPSMAGVGGTERVVDNLSRLFAEAGHKVFQVTFDPPGAPRILSGDTPIYRLGPMPNLPLVFRSLSYALTAFRLAKLKWQLKPDITISNLWRSDLISQLSLGGDKKIALCHINVVDNPTNKLMLQLRSIVAAVYRRFDKVIAVSEPLAKELTCLYRLAPKKIGYVNNFIYATPPRKLLKDDTKWFVWVGRLVSEKNVDGLLHAWAGFARERSDVKLLLIGDGPLREDLIRLASDLGLRVDFNSIRLQGNLVFMGEQLNPEDYISQSRALLLSSTSEGVGLVLLEAMAHGVPLLAADCNPGGVRAALLGSGTHDPGCERGLPIPLGALLPVPDSKNYLLWRPWLEKAAYDDNQWHEWSLRAKDRSKLFSPPFALRKWSSVLNSL
jgi:glycosyltransferase involved in cell wall biosynthesis